MLKTSVLALGLTLSAAGLAAAQESAAAQDPDMAVSAARNQLGVLEYCQTEGHIDGAAVDTQAKLLTLMPKATDEASAQMAYEKGQQGTVSAMGVEQSLADAAARQGTDEAALCTQLASLVEQAGTELPE
ncbi:pore-forming ESAT-6 family protein [Paracoccus aerodenitrificans]|uniref:pore-forming ESAT-6 family protein n=1 Tax=Paracoccus aerodenitrificans TaxID=3017781 RepID=UPI0022F04D61|nr:pore-forming ESAT-6 family protein [Paracoccus aerodenitrificans]WBU64022.1 pore-forming ESAT-6 family protein [Paracoccus aerodenitrificans]